MKTNTHPNSRPKKRVRLGTAGISEPVIEALIEAVDMEVGNRINEMCDPHNQLPEPVADLAWLIEEFAQTPFGNTTNQRLLRRDRIQKIEAKCREIGAGGSFTVPTTENPFNI